MEGRKSLRLDPHAEQFVAVGAELGGPEKGTIFPGAGERYEVALKGEKKDAERRQEKKNAASATNTASGFRLSLQITRRADLLRDAGQRRKTREQKRRIQEKTSLKQSGGV